MSDKQKLKQSHKVILDLLNGGCWLKNNQWSTKTVQIVRGTKVLMLVRSSTIDDMRSIGLLVLTTDGRRQRLMPASQLPLNRQAEQPQ